MKLLILITSRITNGLDVALAWQEAGAPGVTIIRAHGLQSLRQAIQGGHLELPRMVVSMASAMASVIHNVEEKSEVILSVVPHEMVDDLVEATTGVLGDLTLPDNGVLFVLDVERAIGVRDHRPRD